MTLDDAGTLDDFIQRTRERALPLAAADRLASPGSAERGDHDLNPGMDKEGARPELRPAAVLVGVIDRGGVASVLLTLRAKRLSAHAGQIAFPGGRVDAEDRTAIDTALREANEEVSLPSQAVTPIGLLEPYRTRTGFRVLPVLATVSGDVDFKADEREVADIFEVPLEFLMASANHRRYALEVEGKRRHFYAMPYENRYIWGATAGILRIMYERLYAE